MKAATRAEGPHRHRTAALWQTAVLVAALLWPVAGCGAGSGSSTLAPAGGGGAPSSATATGTSTTPSPTHAAPSHPGSLAPRASASAQLSRFITGAERMDAALRSLAVMANGGIGPDSIDVGAGTFAAIDAIDPHRLVPDMPGGMPAVLEHRTLLVFSDLAARRYAFKALSELKGQLPVSRISQNGRFALEGLANGAAPAARFPADLAALRSSAAALPAFTPAAPSSRAAAEVALQVAYIVGQNSGCESSGGWVETAPVQVVWKQGVDFLGQRVDGSIGAIAFRVDYTPGSGWSVYLNAC